MATPTPGLPAQGEASTGLSVDDVTKIITAAKTAAGDPLSIGMQIFSGLGDNATVSGNTLREALSAAAIPIAGPLGPVLNAIQSVTKTGSVVTLTNAQEVQIVLDGNQMQLKNQVSFGVAEQNGLPELQNIAGLAVHKVFWIDIKTIELIVNQGKRFIRVVTPDGSKDIALG